MEKNSKIYLHVFTVKVKAVGYLHSTAFALEYRINY